MILHYKDTWTSACYMGLKEGVWWFKIFQMQMAMEKCTFFSQPDPRGQNNEAAVQTAQQKAKTSRSVIQAALLGLGHPSQTLAYNGGQQWMEAEGNSLHAIIKMEPSILVTKAMRYGQATPKIHHFQCQKVISVGQLEIINLRVNNFFLIIFVLQHSHALVMVIRNHCWNNCLIQLSLEGGDIFLLFLFLIGKDLNMHFSILENIIESHPAMTSDVSDLLQYLQEEAYLSSPGFMQHSRSISSILPFIYRTQVCRPATRLYLSRGPEERCQATKGAWWRRTENQIVLKLLIRHSVRYKPAGGKALWANTSPTPVIGQSVCGVVNSLNLCYFTNCSMWPLWYP